VKIQRNHLTILCRRVERAAKMHALRGSRT
jgi:hypothetical protein